MEQTSANGGALPAECWEEIILRLPPSKIPSIRLLNRRFCELIDGSPVIKYYLDLFSAGLEEGADTGSLSIQDRQQKLESYCSRWESFDRAERAAPLLLPDIDDAYVDKGFFICGEDAGGGKEDIHFMRLPSPAIGLTQKEWTIQAPPASTPYGRRRAIYPPLDLFAISVLSQEESSFQIEMFHMSDGTRYPNYGVMGFDYGPRQRINGIRLELTGRRISARVLTLTRLGRGAFERNVQDLFVWDWRTGEKRLERTQTRIMTARFIDEYRLIGTVRRSDKNVLILWDTSSDTTNDHMCPHGLILETKPRNVSGLTVPDYNMNHELPFRESHSSGVVAFTLRHPGFEATFVEMYVIPVKTLIELPPTGKLEWWEWRHLSTSIWNRPIHPPTHVLHSRALTVYGGIDSWILQVHDFSLRCRRRKAQKDLSAGVPPYEVRMYSMDIDHLDDLFDFTDNGILVSLPVTEDGILKKLHFLAM